MTPDERIARLTIRLERERTARVEAEAIAERGLRDLYRRQQAIALLESIAVSSNEASGVDDVMAQAIREIGRYTQWPVAHVFYVPSDAGAAHACLASSDLWHLVGESPSRWDEFRAVTGATSFPRGAGLPGRVWASGRAEWVEHIDEHDSRFPRAGAASRGGLHTGFAFPVMVGSEVVAVLEFFSVAAIPVDEVLLRLVNQIGAQLGRVIERKRSADRLVYEARHDVLTSLPNRAALVERLRAALARARRRPGCHVAALFLDLDRFKMVNDSLGHLAGDGLIVEVSKRLVACLRDTDLVVRPARAVAGPDLHVARLGGDEFTILLEDVADATAPIRVAERVQRALSDPFHLCGQTVYTSASVGIALSSGDEGVDDLLRDADVAMYRAKESGRGRWALFDQGMHDQAVRHLQIEADLHDAVRRGEFFLCYQPIVSLPDRRVSGFEALVRWQHPQRGLISPAEFVPRAEANGLIAPIGRWVLEQACVQARQWQLAHPAALPITMSVNVSPVQLAHGDLLADVDAVLARTGLRPDTLKLELTESAVMQDADRARKLFLDMRTRGVRLSLDDFGTGYSSLSQLRRLPIDTIKVDRSFVSGLDVDAEKLQIAQLIVTLARTLGFTVVAEGVETPAELQRLNSLRCDYAQGFLFARPLRASEASALLAADARAHVPRSEAA